jgi:Type I phosphodiesterase / nucleotide pyrophosphatase
MKMDHRHGILLRSFALALCSVGLLTPRPGGAAPAHKVENVIVVTLDGVRVQEVFGGMVSELNSKAAGGALEPGDVARRFRRPTPEERREALFPFLWTVMAREGQLFGDPAKGSLVRVTNGFLFSYPGYNELLTGVVDPRIDSNDAKPNPNATVLDWLEGRPGFGGRVAAFAPSNWFWFVLGGGRSRVRVNMGDHVTEPLTAGEWLVREFGADFPAYLTDSALDAPVMEAALDYLKVRQPRVMYVALGETDAWAHRHRYDLYLDAASRADRFLKRLWETAQALPAYRGRTALVVTTDHGRGETARDWGGHGQHLPAASRIWVAVLGPDTPPLGDRASVTATLSQVAASVTALVGEDYQAAVRAAAPPLPGILP